MNKTDYVIFGPDADNGEPQYWDNGNKEWTTTYDKATHYPKRILAGPLPNGVVGIAEVDEQAEICNFYQTEYLPLPGVPFEKNSEKNDAGDLTNDEKPVE